MVAHGRAEVTTSEGPDVDDEIRRITRRYIGEQEVEDYVRRWAELRTIVTIHPDRMTAWSRGY